MKKSWIEILRVMATIAVIFLHISMTIISNYTLEEANGITNYIILDVSQLICRWAVPCFIMITGALLLDQNKKVDLVKIKKYVLRMLIVLMTFGVFYAFLELFFENRIINIKMIFQSILNTLQGKTWAHMWYIYMLIGLYIITPVLKIVIQKLDYNKLKLIILVLIIGTTIIPTINNLFDLNIDNFMVVDVCVLYYISGYYFTLEDDTKYNKKYYSLSIISLFFILLIDILNILRHNTNLEWVYGLNCIFIYILSVGIFKFIKEKFDKKEIKNIFIDEISKYRFAMYLIHPFWINLIYKVFKITPLNFPIGFGIIIMFCIVLILTFISSFIFKKIPIIKKYI